MVTAAIDGSFEQWRDAARSLLGRDLPPGQVTWQDRRLEAQAGLFAADELPPSDRAFRIPQAFGDLAPTVACCRDPDKWPLLYRVLWRLLHGEPHLLRRTIDDDVHALLALRRAVGGDAHKMRAFVRFRKVEDDGGERFIAWHRPQHLIVRREAPWFARRFAAMRWSILTPDDCAHWDGERLSFTDGVPARAAPRGDDLESLWKTYYGSIFNPARIKLKTMQGHLPRRHWATLPETEVIARLLAEAPGRVEAMIDPERLETEPERTDPRPRVQRE